MTVAAYCLSSALSSGWRIRAPLNTFRKSMISSPQGNSLGMPRNISSRSWIHKLFWRVSRPNSSFPAVRTPKSRNRISPRGTLSVWEGDPARGHCCFPFVPPLGCDGLLLKRFPAQHCWHEFSKDFQRHLFHSTLWADRGDAGSGHCWGSCGFERSYFREKMAGLGLLLALLSPGQTRALSTASGWSHRA